MNDPEPSRSTPPIVGVWATTSQRLSAGLLQSMNEWRLSHSRALRPPTNSFATVP